MAGSKSAGATSWTLIAATLGSAMSAIDGSAVNVALPVMQRDLQATNANLQWVIEGYALFLSALILLGGALGDRFGRRKIFGAGIVLFTAASLACAVAPTLGVLVGARCLQGVGGALAVPGSLALISAVFHGAERGKAIGTWSGFGAISMAIGPVFGGYLAQTVGWRFVFGINVLPALVILFALARVPESRDERAPSKVDWGGALLATLGLGALVFGLIEWEGGPSLLALGAAVAGIAALAAFALVERRERAPMLRLDLFASRTFSGANVYTLLLYAALGGSLYFVPFDLVNVQGYSPTAAGAAMLPIIAILFVASRWSGGLIERTGARLPLIVGALSAAAGFLAFAVPGVGGPYWSTFLPPAVLLGCGAALFAAPLTTAVMGAVEDAHAGLASGINNAVSRTAGLLAIAAFGIVLALEFDRSLERRMESAHLDASTVAELRAGRANLASGQLPGFVHPADRERVASIVKASYVDGFRQVMVVSAACSVLAAVVAARSISGLRPRADGGAG